MSLEGIQRSCRVDGKWQIVPYTSCSNSEYTVADGADCRVVYTARSAYGWFTIADTVRSCCQQPSADHLPGMPALRCCDSGRRVRQVGICALLGAQIMQVLEQWSNMVVLLSCCYTERRLEPVTHVGRNTHKCGAAIVQS